MLIEDPGGLSSVNISLLSNVSIAPLQPGDNFLFGATSVTPPRQLSRRRERI
jgi:hypothetical protein